ncbi:DUF3923 family protein [Pediococcus cellicola]|uniref:NADH:ubiquinone oxidoreductase n=1 Tax=Pediococcus cellicola TaxID=319652 RepID=A0A0R2IVR0_9LACO|nr:DUF3923 family protein [Pediococcus cellicola]KRN67029.1 hypothetical protein IV80_GL001119 [Pediococcus cellicola]GEL15037.1 hypothetical protein PCE01_08390 [Pediococcus cellicola]
MQIKNWWIMNSIWFVIFMIATIFILMRKVDGAGIVQTMSMRWLALAVLGIFFVIVLIFQLVVYHLIRNR